MPVFATSVIFGVFAMPEFSGIFHWNLPAGQYSSQPCFLSGIGAAILVFCMNQHFTGVTVTFYRVSVVSPASQMDRVTLS